MRFKLRIWLLVAAFIVGFAFGILFSGQSVDKELDTPELVVQKEEQQTLLPTDLLDKFSKYAQLPENAFIAIIDDVELMRLKQALVYDQAKNGDFVISYDDKIWIYDYKNDLLVGKFTINR